MRLNPNVCKEILQLRNKQYLDGVTLITPTGDRSLQMKLTQLYLSRQTYKGPIQWVLADDGTEHSCTPYLPNVEIEHLKRGHISDRAKSITGNVANALFHVKYDKVLIWEDDDYYRPDYIETTLLRLQNSLLIGEGNSRYYHILEQKYRINHNLTHASLFQTALRSSVLEYLWVACLRRTSAFIDCRLWDKSGITAKKIFVDKITSIGIKGLPGRTGIGAGHRPGKHSVSFQKDADFKILKQWIGEAEANLYIDIYNELQSKEKEAIS